MATESSLRVNPLRDVPRYLMTYQSIIGPRIYLVFLFAGLASMAEGVGLIMILPLLSSLGDFGGEEMGGVGKQVVDLLTRLNLAESTLGILLIFGLFFMLKALFMFFSEGYQNYLRGQLLRKTKTKLYDSYLGMRLQHYLSQNTGHFINVIDTQVMKFLLSFSHLVALGAKAVMVMAYIVVGILVAWRFGVMAIVFAIAIFAAFRRLSVYNRELSRKSVIEAGLISKFVIQSLQSLKYLVSTGQSRLVREKTVASISNLSRYHIRQGFVMAFTKAAQEPLVIVAIVAMVIVQLFWLHQPLGPILVSILLFYRAASGVAQMQHTWQETLSHIGSVEIIQRELEIVSEQREPDGVLELGGLTNGIELRNVHFAFHDGQEDVLSGITLFIPARTSIAFVGPSGSGKSTLIDIVTCMLRPRRGEVLIDGLPAEQLRLSSWREQIGFVSQETVIFDDTIGNNICLWRGNIESDGVLFERVREAARQASLDAVIESLPSGYNTLVGDRGIRLSGGQRQRLFLARELFKRPKLLILDEATSALDSESERAVQLAIDGLKGEVTVIMVAHRLSTIRNADKIVVIEKGRIVEEGEFDSLRGSGHSRFSQLVAMQEL